MMSPVPSNTNFVRVKTMPDLHDDRIEELMRDGIGILDFGSGASVESEAASGGGAGRSFDSYIEFTRDGGYGVLTNEGHSLMTVGFVEGACAMFIDEASNESVTTEKAFQFDEYVVIEDPEAESNELYQVLQNHDHLQTMTNLTNEDNKKVIYDAFQSKI